MNKLKEKIKKLFSREEIVREIDPDLSDEDKALRREMFEKYSAELRALQLSNSQQYDKAILTLSSAGFAVSVTAFEFVTATHYDHYLYMIIASWWLFFTAIASSLISFVVGNKAGDRQLELARDYYIRCFKDAESKKTLLVKINDLLNILAGIFFLSAIFMSIMFFTKIT